MRTKRMGKNITVEQHIAEITGDNVPWADSETKAISLRISENEILRAEGLAQFGQKKRAAILKNAIEVGLDTMISALNSERRAQFDEFYETLKKNNAETENID